MATRLYRQLVDAMNAGDLAAARQAHFRLDPYQRAVMTHIQGAVSSKLILNWQGHLPSPVVRLPLVQATEDEQTIIRADLAEAGLTF